MITVSGIEGVNWELGAAPYPIGDWEPSDPLHEIPKDKPPGMELFSL